jgi:MFS family permease
MKPLVTQLLQARMLAPFRQRSYRYQWHADLATSWAFEMEIIMLSWYILVETRSVFLLTLFASMQYAGTLLSPMFGVMGARLGNKRVYCAMRASYATLAAVMTALVLAGALTPLYVFVIWTALSLVRSSDLVLRYALIGETMPAQELMAATSVSRTTQDSARIMGALAGAGIVATLGLGVAYAVVTGFYVVSLLLSLQVIHVRPDAHAIDGNKTSPWRDLRDGATHVWHTPQLLAAMLLAFLVNVTAFPLTHGLLPHVAKDIYHTDQTGLGYLSASFAAGALLGSIFLTRFGPSLPPARMMVIFSGVWYVMGCVFAYMPTLGAGIAMLVATGFAQSLGMVTMSAMLLKTAAPRFRGHVMGLRILMIYGLPLGLLLSGPLITHFSYRVMATLYCITGLICVVLIALHWRTHIWRRDASANRH